MNKHWPRFVFALAVAAVGIPSIAAAQPVVRDHRHGGGNDNKDSKPTSAPPELKVETVTAKKGFVWVGGHWDWTNGAWAWTDGHWEKVRRGKRWRQIKWEQQNGAWVRVDGGWDAAPDEPDAPPPPPGKDVDANRDNWKDGFVWVPPYWDWKNYQWVWVKGRWEKLQTGKKLQPGHWEQKGDKWQWIADAWIDAGPPTTAPPAPPQEQPKTRAGNIWVAGHYEWINGEYRWKRGHLEKAKPNFERILGHWEQKGNNWVWVEGGWKEIVVAQFPTAEPPAPKVEKIGKRRNFVWVAGYYQWRNGQYEWVGGHWEKVRKGKRWADGRWDHQGDKWVWVDGGWNDAPPPYQFDNKGWTLLGSADVNGRLDRDTIKVGKYAGKFDQVTMVVTDSDLQLDDFVITFGNNETFAPKVKFNFKEGSRTRAIDLPGDDRHIKQIDLQYSNVPGGGPAHVDVYGRDTGKHGGGGGGGGTITTGGGGTASTGGTITTGGTTTTTTTTTGGSSTVTTSGGGSISVTTGGGGGGVSVTVTGPTAAPPALKAEKIAARKGFVWAAGRWDWNNGQWEWLPGHWEKVRSGKTWADGRWEKKGNVYVWVEGGWR
jgi:hypothetical protein